MAKKRTFKNKGEGSLHDPAVKITVKKGKTASGSPMVSAVKKTVSGGTLHTTKRYRTPKTQSETHTDQDRTGSKANQAAIKRLGLGKQSQTDKTRSGTLKGGRPYTATLRANRKSGGEESYRRFQATVGEAKPGLTQYVRTKTATDFHESQSRKKGRNAANPGEYMVYRAKRGANKKEARKSEAYTQIHNTRVGPGKKVKK